MDRIGGPEKIRAGVLDALSNDNAITAKVNWLANTGNSSSDGRYLMNNNGKPRWIHCTPLLGSDEKTGVWMVVMVEDEEITGQLNRQESAKVSGTAGPIKLGAVSRERSNENLYASYLKEERPQTNGSQQTGKSSDQSRDFERQ